MDPKYTRPKDTDTDADSLTVELNGGSYNKKAQKAIIHFICDRARTGNEGKDKFKRDNDTDGSVDNSLGFNGYGPVDGKENLEILNLQWRTKYVCEDFEADEPEKNSSRGWGFFTWFILM